MGDDFVVDIPVWSIEAGIDGRLTQPQLDRLVEHLTTESDRDAWGIRQRTHSLVYPYAGKVSGELTPTGARVSLYLGARDENHARARATSAIRQGVGERNFEVERITVGSCALVMGELDVRAAFHHHIASAVIDLSTLDSSLDAVRGHIESALEHAHALGQEMDGLRSIMGDVDALRTLLHETSLPLFQRLAEAETGTRG